MISMFGKGSAMRAIWATVVAMFAAAGFVTASHAATVTPETGTVMVRTGAGFEPIAGASSAGTGTQVMVSPGGVARISYDTGCTIRLGSGRVWTISKSSPCAKGQRVVDLTGHGRMGQSNVPNGASGQFDNMILTGAVGGAALASGIYMVTKDTDDDNNGGVQASP